MSFRAWLLAAALLGEACPAGAALRLDQISDCASLHAALGAMRAGGVDCRQPQTPTEAALSRALAPIPDVRTCWLRQSPSLALARFRCLRMLLPRLRHLDCIASADPADLESFQQDYERTYAARVARYLGEANACDAGNRRAARAGRTQFMGPLTNVARFRLGFALALGSDPVGTGLALHGFADLDPALAGPGRMIEFVSVWEGLGEPSR